MNLLMGLIPSKLGELSSPIVMDLSYNAFTGEIPSILNKLPLENLDVLYNNFYGVLPLGLLAVIDAKSNLDLCDMANNYEANKQQIEWSDGVSNGWNFCGSNDYTHCWFMLLLSKV
jgi:hypothetical protein